MVRARGEIRRGPADTWLTRRLPRNGSRGAMGGLARERAALPLIKADELRLSEKVFSRLACDVAAGWRLSSRQDWA